MVSLSLEQKHLNIYFWRDKYAALDQCHVQRSHYTYAKLVYSLSLREPAYKANKDTSPQGNTGHIIHLGSHEVLWYPQRTTPSADEYYVVEYSII